MKVHVYGGAGVVTGVYRETGITKGKAYARRARFTDTWIKQDGQWKCVASQSTLIQ
jgi:ketosteroid isomerase-like protein